MKEIKLSKNKKAIVDDCDFDSLSKYNWYFAEKSRSRFGYAVTDLKNKENPFGVRHVTMHRFLLKPKIGILIDHINGNGLDNRRSNLRECNSTQNNANFFIGKKNKSGYKGVSFHKLTNKWRTTLSYKNKQIYGGLFNDKKEAAKKYNELATEYFKNFARLNKI